MPGKSRRAPFALVRTLPSATDPQAYIGPLYMAPSHMVEDTHYVYVGSKRVGHVGPNGYVGLVVEPL